MACVAPLPLETTTHTPPRQRGSSLISPAWSDGSFVSPSPIAPLNRHSEACDRQKVDDSSCCGCGAAAMAATTTVTTTTLSTTNVYGVSLSVDQERSETDDEAANRRRSVRLVFECEPTCCDGSHATQHPSLRLDVAESSSGSSRDAEARVGLSAMTLDRTMTTRLSGTHHCSMSSTSSHEEQKSKTLAEMGSAEEDAASDEMARITGFPTPVKVPSIPTKGTPHDDCDSTPIRHHEVDITHESRALQQPPAKTMPWQDDHVSVSQLTNEDELRHGSHEAPYTQFDSLSAPSSLSHTTQHCVAQQTVMSSHAASTHVDASHVSVYERDQSDVPAANTRVGNLTTTLPLQSPSVSLIQTSAEDSRCGRSTVLDGTIYRETLAAVRPAAVNAATCKADYYFSSVAPPRHTVDKACQSQEITTVAAKMTTRSIATQTEPVAHAIDVTPSSRCVHSVYCVTPTSKCDAAPHHHSLRRSTRPAMPQLRSSVHTAAIDSWMV